MGITWVIICIVQVLITLIMMWLFDTKPHPRPLKVEIIRNGEIVGSIYPITPINDTIQITIQVGGE